MRRFTTQTPLAGSDTVLKFGWWAFEASDV